ncbi:co-chaperone GroES [Candidatus Berkelbacteria bacterium]|nr:co-chaperone GroES [Candidatus Berkelbacteria bacterium]MBI2588126.1 co-chaperone GroES [Candidatus Berkelbacteria bacterium]MBI4029701.1 co-chaperone GroES [Candidatus Berkelbacteria bacterium]
MTQIKPLYDKVLVRPLKGEEKTPAGIVLPDTAKETPQEGKVLAVGEGKRVEGKLESLTVKEGQTVLFSKYAGDEIKIDGEELKIIKEEDILGIIE